MGYTLLVPSDKPYREIKRLLESKGYSHVRTNGSHHIFKKEGGGTFSVPVHRNKVKFGYYKRAKALDQ